MKKTILTRSGLTRFALVFICLLLALPLAVQAGGSKGEKG